MIIFIPGDSLTGRWFSLAKKNKTCFIYFYAIWVTANQILDLLAPGEFKLILLHHNIWICKRHTHSSCSFCQPLLKVKILFYICYLLLCKCFWYLYIFCSVSYPVLLCMNFTHINSIFTKNALRGEDSSPLCHGIRLTFSFVWI